MILAYIFDYGDVVEADERDLVEHYSGLASQGLYETDVAKELLKRITDHFGETHYMTQRATSATRLARLKENLPKVRRN
jgi:predicted small metal-binding protein